MSATGRQTVLFLHPSAEFRGADRVLLELVAAVDRDRWDPVVVLPRRGPIIGELEALGATIEVGPLGVVGEGFGPTTALSLLFGFPRCYTFLRKLLAKHRPTIVHTHTFAVLGGAIAAGLLARGKHTWHAHRVLGTKGLRPKVVAAVANRFANTIVLSSAAAKGALERLRPGLSERTRLVRNCVDQARVFGTAQGRAAVRAKLGIEDENPLVLLLARLEERKGHGLLLEAASSLRYTHPDTRFLIIGDQSSSEPRYAKHVVDEIKRLELEGIVTRLPHQSDISAVYAACDVVCIPSLVPDKVQSVALEAMAAGRPVIAAAHPGTDEYIRTGGNGLFFEPGDVKRLTWCLQTLSGDAQRRATMGHSALETHQSEFVSARFKNEFDRVWSVSTDRAFVLPDARAQIVHFVADGDDSAPARDLKSAVSLLVEAQQRSGLSVQVWRLSKDGPGPSPAHERSFKGSAKGSRLPAELREAIDELDTTAVVHLHGPFNPASLAMAAQLEQRRVPFVVTPHGAFLPGAAAQKAGASWMPGRVSPQKALKAARAVQALSGRELMALEDQVDLARLHAIPCGHPPLAPAPPADLEDADRRPIVMYSGPLETQAQGLDALVDGFAQHVANRGKATLWFVGDGPDREALEARAEELGIQRRVRFLGELNATDRVARLRAADALIRPSRREGMPLALLEAAAAGVPLALTPASHLDTEVRKCHAGHVIGEVDAPNIARVLADIEQEHGAGQLAQRGPNAAWMASTYFTWDRVAALVSRELYGLEVLVPDVPDLEVDQSTEPAPLGQAS